MVLLLLIFTQFILSAKKEPVVIPQTTLECTYYRRLTVVVPSVEQFTHTVYETASFRLDTAELVNEGKFSGSCDDLFLIEEKVLDKLSTRTDVNFTTFELFDDPEQNVFTPFYPENGCDSDESSFFFDNKFTSNDTNTRTFILLYGCQNTIYGDNKAMDADINWIVPTTNQNCSDGFTSQDPITSEEYPLLAEKYLRSSTFLESSGSTSHLHDGGYSMTNDDDIRLNCRDEHQECWIGNDNHGHELDWFQTSWVGGHEPEYVKINFCKRSLPWVVPGDLVFFDSDVHVLQDLPEGFDDVSEQYDGKFIRGTSSLDEFNITGGNNQHNHWINRIGFYRNNNWVTRNWGWDHRAVRGDHYHPDINDLWTQLGDNIPPYYTFRLGEPNQNNENIRNFWLNEGTHLMVAEKYPRYGWYRHIDSVGRFPLISTRSAQMGGDFSHTHEVHTYTGVPTGDYLDGHCTTWGVVSGNSHPDHKHPVFVHTWEGLFDVPFTGLAFLTRNNLLKTTMEISNEMEVGVPEELVTDDDDDDDDDDNETDMTKLGTILGISFGALALLVVCVLLVLMIIVLVIVAAVVLKKKKATEDFHNVTSMVAESAMAEQELEEQKELLDKEKQDFKKERENDLKKRENLEIEIEEMKSSKSLVTYSTNMAFVPRIRVNEIQFGPDVPFERTRGLECPITLHRGKWKGNDVLIRKIPYDALKHKEMDGLKILKFSLAMLMTLNHPNILKYHGYCEVPGKFVLVISDDVKFLNFHSITEVKSLNFQGKVKMLRELTKAMSFLHEKNIFHGNICPSLVYLTPQMVPIIDIGMDKIFKISHEYNPFAAPEVVNPRMEVEEDEMDEDELNSLDLKADVYSFGILIYSLLTQTFDVYKTRGKNVKVGVEASKDGNYRPQSIVANQKSLTRMPNWWINLVDQCTSKYPMERPEFENIVRIVESVQEQRT